MRTRALPATALLCASLCAPPMARAQAPAGPPPPSSGREPGGARVHELLPDIGRIGAQVGIMAGPSWNPYGVGSGFQSSGYVDLPLTRVPGGKLAYEILIGLSDAESDPFALTDPIAYVANLASGASRSAALAGPPQAPFPVRRLVRTRLRLLQVSPFALKYTVKKLDVARLRPYAAAGLDFAVAITRETPERDESLDFPGTAPFDDPLIGGLVAQAPELTARGQPTGQGNIEIGFHAGGGLELRVTGGLSLNVDYRLTRIGSGGARLHCLSSALGFHW